jgi:excisionase family DNA binding protein
MEDLKQYLTVPQVAEKLGFCPDWVRILIKKNHLRAVKMGQWKVRPEDLEAFIKMRRNY